MRDTVYDRTQNTDKCWFRETCEFYKTEKCKSTCVKFAQTDYQFQLSNLPKSQWYVPKLDTVGLSDESCYTLQSIIRDIEYFVKSGFSLYLYGMTGSGKTSWAIKLLGTYFMEIANKNNFRVRGVFINVPAFFRDIKLYMTYKSNDFMELIKDIQKCDLVVWDEIGQTDPTSYESQWLYSLINDRILEKKANIYTSNLSPDQLERLDSRIASRICVGSDCVELYGKDRRSDNTFIKFLESQDVMLDGGSSDYK